MKINKRILKLACYLFVFISFPAYGEPIFTAMKEYYGFCIFYELKQTSNYFGDRSKYPEAIGSGSCEDLRFGVNGEVIKFDAVDGSQTYREDGDAYHCNALQVLQTKNGQFSLTLKSIGIIVEPNYDFNNYYYTDGNSESQLTEMEEAHFNSLFLIEATIKNELTNHVNTYYLGRNCSP